MTPAFIIGFVLFLTLLITVARAVEHRRIWTAFFPRKLEPLSPAMREGFECWQAAALSQSRGDDGSESR